MALSNYEIMRNKMRGEFLKYDQERMLRRFCLESDEGYIYIEFMLRRYRIGRRTGVVEWSCDGFGTACEADYNESMTIYDLLCFPSDGCVLSGRYCPANQLRGTVISAGSGSEMLRRAANRFSGRADGLRRACLALGEAVRMSGDVAARIYPFSFLPVMLQFWEADEEFSARLKFMFDENVLQFMHFETLFFMTDHIVRRLEEMIGS